MLIVGIPRIGPVPRPVVVCALGRALKSCLAGRCYSSRTPCWPLLSALLLAAAGSLSLHTAAARRVRSRLCSQSLASGQRPLHACRARTIRLVNELNGSDWTEEEDGPHVDSFRVECCI